jgi:hypothetical protein
VAVPSCARATLPETRTLDSSTPLKHSVTVFRKLGQVLMIVAVLTATGTHWLAFQSVAWTTMLAENLQTSSLSQAIQRTFDGKHQCCLCKEIAKDKQSEKKSDVQNELKKLDFSHSRFEFVFCSPSHFYEVRNANDTALYLAEPPSLPPPKELLV